MDKNTKRIQIVKENIKECLQPNTAASYYTYGNIPQKCISGAKRKYVGNVKNEDIIGLIDTTVFGGGERGLVFTQEGVYFKDMLSERIFVKYKNIGQFNIKDNVYFDSNEVMKLLTKLQGVENEIGVGEGVASIVSLAGDIFTGYVNSKLEEISKEAERKEKEESLEVLESIKQMKYMFNVLNKNLKANIDIVVDVENEEQIDVLGQYFHNLGLWASLLADKEWFEEEFLEETTQEIYEQIDTWQETIETLTELFEDVDEELQEQGMKNISVHKLSGRFAHRIKMIFEELEEESVEELYDRSQVALKEFSHGIRIVIKNLNILIDLYYGEVND